jgi:hypothetical protein
MLKIPTMRIQTFSVFVSGTLFAVVLSNAFCEILSITFQDNIRGWTFPWIHRYLCWYQQEYEIQYMIIQTKENNVIQNALSTKHVVLSLHNIDLYCNLFNIQAMKISYKIIQMKCKILCGADNTKYFVNKYGCPTYLTLIICCQ